MSSTHNVESSPKAVSLQVLCGRDCSTGHVESEEALGGVVSHKLIHDRTLEIRVAGGHGVDASPNKCQLTDRCKVRLVDEEGHILVSDHRDDGHYSGLAFRVGLVPCYDGHLRERERGKWFTITVLFLNIKGFFFSSEEIT